MVALGKIDVCGDLFERRYPFYAVKREIFYGSEETSWSCGDVYHGVYCIFETAFFQECHFSLFWNIFSLYFLVF